MYKSTIHLQYLTLSKQANLPRCALLRHVLDTTHSSSSCVGLSPNAKLAWRLAVAGTLHPDAVVAALPHPAAVAIPTAGAGAGVVIPRLCTRGWLENRHADILCYFLPPNAWTADLFPSSCTHVSSVQRPVEFEHPACILAHTAKRSCSPFGGACVQGCQRVEKSNLATLGKCSQRWSRRASFLLRASSIPGTKCKKHDLT